MRNTFTLSYRVLRSKKIERSNHSNVSLSKSAVVEPSNEIVKETDHLRHRSQLQVALTDSRSTKD